MYEIKTVSDLDAVLTDGLAQLQKIIARWAKRAIDPAGPYLGGLRRRQGLMDPFEDKS